MRKLFILCGVMGFGLAVLNACTDHEVIPPPVPLVDLNCECEMMVGDTSYSYTDTCKYRSTKNIVSGGTSTAQYITSIEGDEGSAGTVETGPGSVEVEIRSINWIDDGSNNPTIDQWKTFFDGNIDPGYSDNLGHPGIEVRWIDKWGQLWISDTMADVCVENFVFNTLIQETDITGDYMQFDATLNCRMIRVSDGFASCLTGGHIRSSFRLE